MEKITLSKAQARRFLLAHQNLWPLYSLEGKNGIVDYIRKVGCIQFDPLNIAGHNHELTLQARVRGFRPGMVQELLYQDRRLLDGFDKNMSIYCVEDWPYFRRYREDALRHFGDSQRPVAAILEEVRREFEQRGPLSSLDLDFNESVDWSWAPTRLSRAALESMYFWGELVIHHKVHTRRVYDLASRLIPAELLEAPEPNPSEEEYHDWYVLRRIGALGLLWNRAGDPWLGMSWMKSAQRQAALRRLDEQGKVCNVNVEGMRQALSLRSADLPTLEETLGADDPEPKAAILAPLDNLMWDRQLVRELFDFDYRWEVYKPVAEREYGYYVLPILYGDRLVARFEPVRDTKRKTLQIRNWWWQKDIQAMPEMAGAIKDCLENFADFLDVPALEGFHPQKFYKQEPPRLICGVFLE